MEVLLIKRETILPVKLFTSVISSHLIIFKLTHEKKIVANGLPK